VDKIDPLETVAVIGGTVIIKYGINWAEEALIQEAKDGNPFNNTVLNILVPASNLWKLLFPEKTTEEQEKMEKDMRELLNSPQAEVLEWLVSFTLSFLIVRNLGNLDTTSILTAAKGLIGVIK